MLKVLEAPAGSPASVTLDASTVTLVSDNPNSSQAYEELGSQEAVALALQTISARGQGSFVFDKQIGPYAVNKEGEALDQVKDAKGSMLPYTNPRMKVDHYRVDLRFNRAI